LEYKEPKKNEKVKWYLRPVIVLLSLFFVLGPFGLPLLYKSPKFSRTLKIIFTVAVIIYTSYLIFVSLEIARELYERVEEFKEILG
jgi:polyferredoxin